MRVTSLNQACAGIQKHKHGCFITGQGLIARAILASKAGTRLNGQVIERNVGRANVEQAIQ